MNDSEKVADDDRANFESAARRHARAALAPLGVEPTFEGVAGALMSRAERDPALAKLFLKIQKEAGDGRSLVDDEQSALLDRLRPDTPLDLPSAPDWLRPAVVAGYRLAESAMTPQVAMSVLRDPKAALRKGLAAVRSWEPGFIGELIVEATMAQRDAATDARLRESADRLRPMVDRLYGDVPGSAIAARAGSTTGARCQACRGNRCTPVSCWVIVVIIIVIIVTK